MAGRDRKTASAKGQPAREPAGDRDDLSVADLARGVLAREIRPRVAEVRRLAEAVLVGAAGGKKGKKDKRRPDKKKGGDKKVKKLARIPGQKAKN